MESKECVNIHFHGRQYHVLKIETESYNVLYDRAWIIARLEPSTAEQYDSALVAAQRKINELVYGYSYE